jgi:flagellin-like hook-associated protein FlgL
VNQDGKLDLINSIGATVQLALGNGDGSFGSYTTISNSVTASEMLLSDINNDGRLDIVGSGASGGDGALFTILNLGNGTFGSTTSYSTLDTNFADTFALGDINGDGVTDAVTIGDSPSQSATFLGSANGTFSRQAASYTEFNFFGVSLSDINADGLIDLVGTTDTGISIRRGLGDGNFSTSQLLAVTANDNFNYSVLVQDINNDGAVDLVVGGNATTNTRYDANVFLAQTASGVGALNAFSLKSVSAARSALTYFKGRISAIASQRGQIGAFDARLHTGQNLLSATIENFRSAESKIKDADIASESAHQVRLSILQQVGASLLAQANQQPALALQLLR